MEPAQLVSGEARLVGLGIARGDSLVIVACFLRVAAIFGDDTGAIQRSGCLSRAWEQLDNALEFSQGAVVVLFHCISLGDAELRIGRAVVVRKIVQQLLERFARCACRTALQLFASERVKLFGAAT